MLLRCVLCRRERTSTSEIRWCEFNGIETGRQAVWMSSDKQTNKQHQHIKQHKHKMRATKWMLHVERGSRKAACFREQLQLRHKIQNYLDQRLPHYKQQLRAMVDENSFTYNREGVQKVVDFVLSFLML